MQTYQSTPDYYRDVIQHGWVKDQAAKVHKYIKRWRNKAGKWVYEYKNNRADSKIRKYRDNLHLNPEDVTYNARTAKKEIKKASKAGQWATIGYRGESGKPKSTSKLDSGRVGARRISTTHIDLNNTKPKRKARAINAFNARQAQLAENRRKTAANVARKREMRRIEEQLRKDQADFEKAWNSRKYR